MRTLKLSTIAAVCALGTAICFVAGDGFQRCGGINPGDRTRPAGWSELASRTPDRPRRLGCAGTRAKTPRLRSRRHRRRVPHGRGRRDAGRHDDGHRGDLAGPADVQVSGIEEHIREPGVAQGLDRNASTCSSSPAQIRETSDFEIPDSTPSACTRSSTARVETPLT
jgi:hypothetical protein